MNKLDLLEIMVDIFQPSHNTRMELLEQVADEILALHKKHVVDVILPEYDEYRKRHKATMEARVEVPVSDVNTGTGVEQPTGVFQQAVVNVEFDPLEKHKREVYINKKIDERRYAIAIEVLDEFNADEPLLDCSDIGELYNWLESKT